MVKKGKGRKGKQNIVSTHEKNVVDSAMNSYTNSTLHCSKNANNSITNTKFIQKNLKKNNRNVKMKRSSQETETECLDEEAHDLTGVGLHSLLPILLKLIL